jgi:hypothetical protein
VTASLSFVSRSSTSNYNPQNRVPRTAVFAAVLGSPFSTSFDMGVYIGPTKQIEFVQGIILNNTTTAEIVVTTVAGSQIPINSGSTYMGPILWGLYNVITFNCSLSGAAFSFTLTNFPLDVAVLP